MNRLLQWINLAGVLALAGLCAWQWQVNRQTHLWAEALERVRLEQVRQIAQQQKTISEQLADLDELHQRVTKLDDALRKSEATVATLTQERDRLVVERDHLTTALAQWQDAVKKRDDALMQANAEIQKLSKDRNDIVLKLNDLTEKYNALVKQWNNLADKGK